MANKKKTTSAIVAGVAAAALLLGGTFAWTSISQQAKNEAAGIVNVGGRLHDDFNGENKDIYVENFTDPMNGGQPIYARIRLDEYMEVGSEAGKYDAVNGTYVEDRNAQSVIDGATIDDVTTWTPHVPDTVCEICANGDTCLIHDHWEWKMGNGEAKYFMPTFNKDKDSLDADINGTYHGTDPSDKIYYDDYVEYAENQTVTKDAYYDNDTDTDKNVVEPQYRTETETHTAKLTGTAEVITMQQWIDEGSNPGNFWVYDTDGWAYWANPIMPGESTGFLLDSIEMIKNPGEKCYYAINVVAQFATVGDWEYFTDKDGNFDIEEDSDALTLLETVSTVVPTVTVTNVSGVTTVEPGQEYTFDANVFVSGAAVYAAANFEWSVFDENMKISETSTVVDGVLFVGETEQSKTLTVVAKAKDYLGAVGMSSVAVKDVFAPFITLNHTYNESGENNGSAYRVDVQLWDVKPADYPITVNYYFVDEYNENFVPETDPDYTQTLTSEADSEIYLDAYSFHNGQGSRKDEDSYSSHNKHVFISVTDALGNIRTAITPERLQVSFGCFVAGTQVQTVNGPVAIENIQVGDVVYSIDLTTGEKVAAAVTWVQGERYTDETYTIRVGGEEIVTTYEHPFYVVGKEWVVAGELKAGDKLLTDDGEELVIDEIIYTPLDEPIQIYNFTVEGTHNYLVGENGILVHNKV